MPLVKCCLVFWITLPQCRGEFFIYEALAAYILRLERILLLQRATVCSKIIRLLFNVSSGSIKSFVTFASEEAIVKTQEQSRQLLQLI